MGRTAVWLVSGGALLLLIGIVWLLREPRGSRPVAESEGAAPGSEDPVARGSSPAPAREAVQEDEPVTTTADSTSAPLGDRRFDWLRGTVVEESGAPVPGARVVARRADSSDSTILWQMDPGFHERLERAAGTETGADGRFRFELPRGIPFDLEASTAGGAEGAALLRCAGEDVLVKLVRHAVHGRLTRASDGAPIADALVRVFSWPSYASRESRSGADGRYRVTFPFDAGLYLEVLPLREEATQWTWIELDPSGQKEMDFVLADGVAVAGRVTEAQSGRPLAGAIVGEGWQFRRLAVTDAEGRYRLPGIGGAGAYGLAAKARGHGAVKRMELPSVRDGAIHVDFELPLAWSASGHVVDGAGNPVENALVVADGHVGDRDGQMLEQSSCRSDRDGRFRIEDLSPVGGRHWLRVRAPGFAQLRSQVPDPIAGGESVLGELVLLPPVLVAGRVLSADGNALLEAKVIVQNDHDWRHGWTDALGRFAFGDLAAGSYRLKASWNSRAARPDIELALAVGEIREGLELRVPRGETLSGRVVDERGAGIRGVYLTAELDEAFDEAEAEDPEDHAYFEETSDENGAFRFDDLVAGEYFLTLSPSGIQSDPDAPWLVGHARSRTGSAPAEIVLVKGDTIRGRVLDASGAPLVNFTVGGRDPAGHRTLVSGTDALGRFELWVERGTSWDLVVSGPWQGKDSEKELLVERGVTAGMRGIELRLPPR